MEEIITIIRKGLEFVRKFTKNLDIVENDRRTLKKSRNNERTRENERIVDDGKYFDCSSKRIGDNPTEENYYLTDEPILRDLLLGIPTEHDLFDIVCTINQLLLYYLVVRGISLRICFFLEL